MTTITIHQNSLFLRFFLWVWGTDPERLNVCKLFWGSIFFPFGILFASNKRRVVTYAMIGAFYVLLTIHFFAEGSLIYAVACLFWAIVYTLLTCVFHQSLDTNERGRVLSKITEHGSAIMGNCLEGVASIFDRVADYDEREENEPAEHSIKGFFSLVREYMHSAKRRWCPLIRIQG